MIQGASGGIAWLSIYFVYRIIIPPWRQLRSRFSPCQKEVSVRFRADPDE
ncbi:uncharacterized protein METZ01_LOCUS148714 [marine metagenome]|uniref:Uncharacterized protein n=1 Tax=marine metagenome TaxID=408172 RepID=A0A382A2X7_9ZZZZ